MDSALAREIINRLQRSDYWGEKTKDSGGYINRLICPSCKEPRAFTDTETPGCIICNRRNECGDQHNIFKLFPDLRENVEKEHPATPEDPQLPARHYLITRGLKKSIEGLDFEYKRNIGGPGRGGVGFPFVNKHGETVWNTRLFKPGDGAKTRNQKDAIFEGAYWRHPGKEYDKGKETYVTEGVIEALSLIEMGFQAIALPSAVNKPTGMNLDDFPNLVLAFNNDLEGWKALSRWRKHFSESGAILPSGRDDWNDFLNRHGDNAAVEFTAQREKFKSNCEGIDDRIREAELWKKINKRIDEISRTYAVIMWGGKFRVMREFKNQETGRDDFVLMGKEDFLSWYANDMVENPFKGRGQSKQVSIGSLWLKAKNRTDPKTEKQKGRRQYKGIAFKPPVDTSGEVRTEGYYNLWQGFAIKPKQGACNLYLKHVRDNIVGGDKDHFGWLLAWMARIVQSPGGPRPGTAFAMLGGQGTGKGTVVEPFEAFFGVHYMHVFSQEQLTGRFNGHLKNAVVVFCDEALWGGNKAAEGVIKGMITEPLLPIEDKNERIVALENRVNLFVASNNDWAIPAGMDERRWFVIKTATPKEKQQSTEYFGPIKQEMSNGGNAALLHYLLNLDISGVDLRKAPKTPALLAQIEHSMDPIQRWWYSCLIDAQNDPDLNDWQEDFVETDRLYNYFESYTRKYRPSGHITPKEQFIRKLKDLVEVTPIRPRNEGRKRGYAFPSIEKCREAFEHSIEMKLNWEEF